MKSRQVKALGIKLLAQEKGPDRSTPKRHGRAVAKADKEVQIELQQHGIRTCVPTHKLL